MPYAALPRLDFKDTPAGVRAAMRGNRHTDTKPEAQLRSALHSRGLRFRKNVHMRVGGPRGVRVDIAFTRRRIAVFVDGCFWHACPEHGRTPKANSEYWAPKLRMNAQRDTRNTAALEAAGWKVVRIWEHEQTDVAVDSVLAALDQGPPGAETR